LNPTQKTAFNSFRFRFRLGLRVYQEQSNSVSANRALIQALVTPSERYPESNQKVQWAATGPSDYSPDISQRELRELERGFAETEFVLGIHGRHRHHSRPGFDFVFGIMQFHKRHIQQFQTDLDWSVEVKYTLWILNPYLTSKTK
jgi:hypothetical protein